MKKWWSGEGANWYWVYWAKASPENDENAIDLSFSGVQDEDEEDIYWLTSLRITETSWW